MGRLPRSKTDITAYLKQRYRIAGKGYCAAVIAHSFRLEINEAAIKYKSFINRPHNVVNGSYRTKSIKGYGWNDSLERRVWLHVIPFCSKKHFCVVYDATFSCFYLINAVFHCLCCISGCKTLSLRCKIWYQYQK